MKLKETISKAAVTIKTGDMKNRHNRKELANLKQLMKSTEAAARKVRTITAVVYVNKSIFVDHQHQQVSVSLQDSTNLKRFEDEVNSVCAELERISYKPGLAEELDEERRNLKHEVQGLDQKVNHMSRSYPWLNFRYLDPERGFDRNEVYGVAANLFDIKNSKFFIALDTAGGSKVP